MAKWSFEPGHTAAEFSARHMMENGGIVVGDIVQITIDAEAILEDPV